MDRSCSVSVPVACSCMHVGGGLLVDPLSALIRVHVNFGSSVSIVHGRLSASLVVGMRYSRTRGSSTKRLQRTHGSLEKRALVIATVQVRVACFRNRWTGRYRWIGRQVDRKIGKWIGRWIDRCIHICRYICIDIDIDIGMGIGIAQVEID